MSVRSYNKTRLMAYVPKAGYVINPLNAYPRNLGCFCGSEVKFKKCCFPKMPRYVQADKEAKLKQAVDMAHELSAKWKARART